jgi:hypothetical protein
VVLPVCEEEDDDCLRRNYCLSYYCLRRNYCSTYCDNDYLRNYCSTYYDNDCSKKRHEGLVVLEVWDDGGGGDDAREVCDGDDAQVSPVDKVFPLVCDDGGDDAWRNCCSKKNYYYSKKNYYYCSKKKN